jgi:hypothetical protein
MVIYEWKDVEYLGKVTSQVDETLPVRPQPAPASVLTCLSRNTLRGRMCAHRMRPATASAT